MKQIKIIIQYFHSSRTLTNGENLSQDSSDNEYVRERNAIKSLISKSIQILLDFNTPSVSLITILIIFKFILSCYSPLNRLILFSTTSIAATENESILFTPQNTVQSRSY